MITHRPNIFSFVIKVAITIAAIVFFENAEAQNKNKYRQIEHQIIDFTNEKLNKTEELINKKLDEKDSLYVVPNQYNMTIMTQYSYNYEYYRFTSSDEKQTIAFRPDNGNKIGMYIGWKWIFLGWSFDLTKNSAKKDINLSFYTARVGFDLFYRKRDEGFKISKTDGFLDNQGEEVRDYDKHFNGFGTVQKGFNVYYIFNHKRFSYPAAYSQTTAQRISAGSFILGLNYNEQSFNFKHGKLDPKLQASISPELKFYDVKYKDYSINFGYSYNWVFAKNCLANISFTPAVGYKNTSLHFGSSKEFLSNINFDVVTRAAIVYNNQKYYIGASFVSHTYSYHKSTLSVMNGFGVLNIYAGFNFWKKKKSKNQNL